MPNTICVGCQKEFFKNSSAFNRTVRTGLKHFCSKKCFWDRCKSQTRQCEVCSGWVKKGNRFCSKPCYTKWQDGRQRVLVLKPELTPTEVKCATPSCENRVFARWGKRMKFCSTLCSGRHLMAMKHERTVAASPNCIQCGRKTGTNRKPKFCTNACWRAHQRIHRVTFDYRQRAFEIYPHVCRRCGIDDLDVLEVHYLDHNHSNNKDENLFITCANCHLKLHRLQERELNSVLGSRTG